MSLATDSRYASQPILEVENSEGVYNPTIYGPQPFIDSAFYHYVVVQGDRLDDLANTFLGDPTLWWEIADSNPQIFYPDVALVPGSILRIPVNG